jgi:hypothetical protein
MEQEIYMGSEFKVTDRSPRVENYVQATFSTFSITA